MASNKELLRKRLKGIESGDPDAATVANEYSPSWKLERLKL